jgi:hypothetical protein
MKIRPRISLRIVLCFAATLSPAAPILPLLSAQNPSAPAAKGDATPPRSLANSRVTISVTGGDKNVAVENASVYVKYIEERKLIKDKKLELNIKTSREGIAHVPNAPTGRVLIQVVADGWKSYGRWYDITDPNQKFEIHLERPPKWY